MFRTLILLSFPVFALKLSAQDHGFSFGHVTYEELDMNVYPSDTSAVAVVLNEFGEAYFDNGGNNNLILEYHVKIKILRTRGLDKANYVIPLWRLNVNRAEIVRDIQASSFNRGPGGIEEQKVDARKVFTERSHENLELKKFAIPNVQVGSVIEIKYRLESPFIWNFRKWEFQTDIPKLRSEYWALIPGNYNYNISLKGYLKLSSNKSELIKDCFTPGGGHKADCSLLKFEMKNVPAFIEEEYMTASSNFLSSINFEIAEVRDFYGGVDKKTREWKDVEEELRKHQSFGVQLKRGKDIMSSALQQVIANEKDPLERAKQVYEYVKTSYRWNGDYSKYCDRGIKKAFEAKSGNVGDINLSLVAALRYAGLEADPVILSTRENGIATELYPVISEFNYVVARVVINDTIYALDATDPYLSFGMLPLRCLNGKGRVIGDRKTSWQELTPAEKYRQSSFINLKLEEDGRMKGIIQSTYVGYEALRYRKRFSSFNSKEDFVKDMENSLQGVNIRDFELVAFENPEQPVVETIHVELNDLDDAGATLLFNPFMVRKWNTNPFKSNERQYPVDFGALYDERITISIEYPQGFEVLNTPEQVALSLPNSGGKYIFSVQSIENKLEMSNWFTTSKPYYTSVEYHYLRELFNRIIQVQNTDIIFRRR